ncbi:hypothetical protein KSP39_PZI022219 [Platanthera zijinensis]|uniref:Reverse transcriptase domain-containing protein n=1 Tax=Platanthera zijinensis TaxID=2320716 RepID=A0AAP0AUN1_9ASPA
MFGFPVEFARWILQCVEGPKFAFLLNGPRTRWIEASCGFRQGCPLSPYLLILCSELLSLAFSQRGNSLGVMVAPSGPRISHLLYADDIFITSDATKSCVDQCLVVLYEYCTWTGQRINRSNSMVMFGKPTPTGRCNRLTR